MEFSFANFTHFGVRHRVLQDLRSKLNINKLRRMLKVVIPRIITANTTRKSFEGAMLVCYCAINFVLHGEAERKQPYERRKNSSLIRPTEASSRLI